MRKLARHGLTTLLLALLATAPLGCNDKSQPSAGATPPESSLSPAAHKAAVQQKADAFLKSYLDDYARLEKAQTTAYWKAANSGKKEDFDASAKAELAVKELHSSPERYTQVVDLLKERSALNPMTVRSLEVAELAFKGNQLPKELLKRMVDASAEIEQQFKTFRGEMSGKKYSNNELLEMLAKERTSKKRQAIWEAMKQVGDAVAPKIALLAKTRNEAAQKLGYANFWDMQVRLQEHDPAKLLAVFSELEQLTNEPFKKMKEQLDTELSKRLKVKPEAMMPWHYDNPFFQAPPPSESVNLDEFYKDKTKEQIVEIATKYFNDIGIDISSIVNASDLYEREGKDQHAFCISIDRKGDVRTLLNVKPTAEWMGTMLHEQGHAIYYQRIDRSLPFNLRESAHIFTTEASAMLFGALAANPLWLTAYAGADQKRVKAVEQGILEQRRREQLIFTRWTLVMLHFEKALYENPQQPLASLWWDMVEKYQMLKRPEGRTTADWASKPHFTIAPVYYHNYMLGEVFAAQLRHTLARKANHAGPTSTLSFNGRKDFGTFLTEKVFRPGMRAKWPDFIKQATGEELTAKYFADEVK